MATVGIENELRALVDRLSALRTATPVTDPCYQEVEKRYREASDLLEQASEVAIDNADDDYLAFAAEMEKAIAALAEAQQKVAKISKAITLAAQVIDIAGKIISRF